MTIDMCPLFAQTSSSQSLLFQALVLVLCVPTIIAVVAIWAGAWTKVHRLQLDNALKQQMIERGMSAEEIVAVLTSRRPGNHGVEPPCASEVVVESDGEWHTGLILKHDGERFLVHYVGTDMSDNEWVSGDRVRVPASKDKHCGAPWDWTFPAGTFAASKWCGKAEQAKPAPVDVEI